MTALLVSYRPQWQTFPKARPRLCQHGRYSRLCSKQKGDNRARDFAELGLFSVLLDDTGLIGSFHLSPFRSISRAPRELPFCPLFRGPSRKLARISSFPVTRSRRPLSRSGRGVAGSSSRLGSRRGRTDRETSRPDDGHFRDRADRCRTIAVAEDGKTAALGNRRGHVYLLFLSQNR